MPDLNPIHLVHNAVDDAKKDVDAIKTIVRDANDVAVAVDQLIPLADQVLDKLRQIRADVRDIQDQLTILKP